MMVGVIQKFPAYIRIWFVMTGFSIATSVLLALSFLLQVKHTTDLLGQGGTLVGHLPPTLPPRVQICAIPFFLMVCLNDLHCNGKVGWETMQR